MFKFDFSRDDVEAKENPDEPEIHWVESKEITIDTTIIKQILQHKELEVNSIELKDVNIKHVSSRNVINVLKENKLESDILKAESNHSDLIAGVYEGGLKVWECTYDLAHFICENQFLFESKKVLDLGCGMGIIGILALLKGAFVDFQDYVYDFNGRYVVEYITMLNVYLTMNGEKSLINKSKFYSGDWESFTNLLCDVKKHFKYDYIFTSETIYNSTNYKKLIHLFKRLLSRDGKIYLAAKTYYFGVGGGLRQFEDSLKDDGTFTYSTVWKCSEGINREILEIVYK